MAYCVCLCHLDPYHARDKGPLLEVVKRVELCGQWPIFLKKREDEFEVRELQIAFNRFASVTVLDRHVWPFPIPPGGPFRDSDSSGQTCLLTWAAAAPGGWNSPNHSLSLCFTLQITIDKVAVSDF